MRQDVEIDDFALYSLILVTYIERLNSCVRSKSCLLMKRSGPLVNGLAHSNGHTNIS
jgi:hypothetical protein